MSFEMWLPFAGRDRLHHQRVDANPDLLDAAGQVVNRRLGAGDDRRLDFEAAPKHASRVVDPFLAVDDEVARHDVDHLAVVRHVDDLGRLQRPLDVVVGDDVVAAPDRDHTVAVGRANVRPGDTDEGAHDLEAGLLLGLLDGGGDCLHRLVDVHDHATTHPARWRDARADDLELVFG